MPSPFRAFCRIWRRIWKRIFKTLHTWHEVHYTVSASPLTPNFHGHPTSKTPKSNVDESAMCSNFYPTQQKGATDLPSSISIKAIIDYGTQVFGLTTKFRLYLLDTIQNTYFRLVLRAFPTSPALRWVSHHFHSEDTLSLPNSSLTLFTTPHCQFMSAFPNQPHPPP